MKIGDATLHDPRSLDELIASWPEATQAQGVFTSEAITEAAHRRINPGDLSLFDDEKLWRCEDGAGRSLHEVIDGGHVITPPLWIDGEQEDLWTSEESTFLDVNSKTALYPLYAALSLFWRACDGEPRARLNRAEMALWHEIVEKQIFVNCRVPYSASIARRVLRYHGEGPANTAVVDILELKKALKDSNGKLRKAKAQR